MMNANTESVCRSEKTALSPLVPIVATALACLLVLGGAQRAGAGEAPYDVVVYGDSAAAVIAAIKVKREGKSVVFVNPRGFVGGMCASGLTASDVGRSQTIGGMSREFFGRVAAVYGKDFIRSFESSVGEKVFREMLEEAGVGPVLSERLDLNNGVTMDGQRITAIRMESGKVYRGKMFIDATYTGDLMALAGVSYTVGREPESEYGESLAGVRRGDTVPRKHYAQTHKDHFLPTSKVDPYVVPGDPSSGLLPWVQDIRLVNGEGDKKTQAYNFRITATKDPGQRVPWVKPEGYKESDYELLLRNFEAGDHRMPILQEPLPNGKQDWNTKHAVSSDMAGANWDYPEADYETRERIENAHERYQRGLYWTLANHPRVPEKIRKEVSLWGLSSQEFADNDHWPYLIYIREARRMVSGYVMTQVNCEKNAAPDPVAMGSFGFDSHAVQYFVNEDGYVRREGVIWRTPRPYGISYRSIVPKRGECDNLFVPVCLSASHVAHGSIRMEPVFMALGHTSGLAACLAIDKGVSVQDVSYEALREQLLSEGQVISLDDAGQKTGKKTVDHKGLKGLVMDDADAQKVGDWEASTSIATYVGSSCVHDGDVRDGKRSTRFEFETPEPGRYEVRVSYAPAPNRASNTPVRISHGGGNQVIRINQRDTPPIDGLFTSLGKFGFDTRATISISNEQTDGYVIADCVQLLAADPG